ncbi:SRPBCC family protein [Flavobacterium pectinovorum]|uniref:SRPBCC family protein n=1 Tax=Flavobacterium pectinovorum TaxID=29533 RepID=UPI001FAC7BB2|nr:transcriptional regulator [Flavobacterium pectinovorum]MCI9844619.1 transcriptional regulator [Flavobacterium pectinovorum]
MKILKYLFLLLILSFVALTVFVATQKGLFAVERSKVVNSPRAAVYHYVNDFRNFEDFESWAVEDPTIKMSFPEKTVGNGASFSWENSEGKGGGITLQAKDGESIHQKISFDGTDADVHWIFKDTLNGKTKVTWKAKGEMSFLFKIYTVLNGGSDKIIGTMYEKTLVNIDKNLDYETKTYAVKVNGIVKKTESFYIKQTFTSEIQKVNKNARIVIPKLMEFGKTNNLYTNGKPFIIYHTYDTKTNLAKISICLPINKEISISAGSDILSGKLNSFEAVKTTLKGDYSHTNEAISKTTAFINNEKITPDLSWSHLEILTAGKLDVKSSSKLVTEIYYPIIPKVKPIVEEVPQYKPEADPAAQKTTTNPVVKKPAATPPAKTNATEEEDSEF